MQAAVTDNTATINATALTNSNLSGSAGITNANMANPNVTVRFNSNRFSQLHKQILQD